MLYYSTAALVTGRYRYQNWINQEKKCAIVKAHVLACKTKDCTYCEALRNILETKGFCRRVPEHPVTG